MLLTTWLCMVLDAAPWWKRPDFVTNSTSATVMVALGQWMAGAAQHGSRVSSAASHQLHKSAHSTQRYSSHTQPPRCAYLRGSTAGLLLME